MRSRFGNSSVLPTSKKMTLIFDVVVIFRVRASGGRWFHFLPLSENRVAENNGRRPKAPAGLNSAGCPVGRFGQAYLRLRIDPNHLCRESRDSLRLKLVPMNRFR